MKEKMGCTLLDWTEDSMHTESERVCTGIFWFSLQSLTLPPFLRTNSELVLERSWLEQISVPQASNLVDSVVWSLVLPANLEHLEVAAALHLEF